MILLLFLIFIVAVFIAIGVASSSRHSESFDYPEEYSSSTKQRYQIGASVSPSFYNDVQNYCRRNGITISDLIRNAVRAYIGSSSTSYTNSAATPQINSSGSWECPNCGRSNASYVGTCACGISQSAALKNPSGKPQHRSARKKTVPSDSWRCPKCGIVNSNLVGTCACGTTKPKDKIITYYEL